MGNYLIYLLFFLLFILLILLYKRGKKALIRKSYIDKKLSQIDKMTGEEFEKLLKAHFEEQGYKVELTPKSNDYGADLVLETKKERIVVQAKRYKNKVGNKAVQEIVSAKPFYNANRAMVITNSYFTQNAVNLARANDVILWNRKELQKKFKLK